MILIADSGSTKTAWVRIDDKGNRTEYETQGVNPVRDTVEVLKHNLTLNMPDMQNMGMKVRFYGAGCISPYSDTVKALLEKQWPNAEIRVESDLLGAAHALCGNAEGIACILGTGSNSCLYDGQKIVENVSPLGWILGDEGSGAVLGRNLVGDVLKGQMSKTLCETFLHETGLTHIHIIEKVYRQPMPNRFLASMVPFLTQHRTETEIHCFLVENFRRFFKRNIVQYGRPDLPVSFVGGVAYSLCEELAEAAQLEGFCMGKVLKKPIQGIADYVISNNEA